MGSAAMVGGFCSNLVTNLKSKGWEREWELESVTRGRGFTLPTKHKHHHHHRHGSFSLTCATANHSSEYSSTSTTTFGRLKAQKIKALIHRTKQHHKDKTRDSDDDEYEDEDEEEYSNARPRTTHFRAKGKKGWGESAGGSYNAESSQMFVRKNNPKSDSNLFFSLKSFKDVGYSDFMIQSMHKLSYTRPSHVQAMSFPSVLSAHTCLIADQSGSGKTLAYLAPIIQRLRLEELDNGLSSSQHHQPPRLLILAPTAELASQVLDTCRSISKSGVPFKSMLVTGGFRQKTQIQNLKQGVDVLIATPGRFLFLIKEGLLQLTNLRCAVLDEVDILFGDEDFEAALQHLINSSPVTMQYLFVTATLPKDVYSKLVEVFPDCEMIMGPSMHRISSRLEEVLVDCSGEEGQEKTPETAFLNKKSALLQLAEESPVPRTIVFCNKIETCRKVENALNRFDRKGSRIQVLPFHAAMTQESRHASMKEFTRPPSKQVSQFMVCTDRASRGIDFAGVDHVILFDFPRDPSEYVRRVGRTARGARGEGKAFIFVVGKQISLARKIMERNRKGHPLHDVPSAYELMK
ncbi:hypothetical protein RIF29_18571 [Crotalaria pallida]|uniref:DEAD-box ATP-dependent RNA helicase 50 n=1 Tax=Crotalaria pallida TaxID=3830 RepID=A0AAN9IGB1_CROPI